jgi:PPK2 family polyphosphate:nucleotide phosphotransferase
MDFRDQFIVRAGTAPKLSRADPSFTPKNLTRGEAEAQTSACVERLGKLQYQMWAEQKHALLVVLQGLDASGKDGTVRHVMTGINPAGIRVTSFKTPTKEELAHDFLWRAHAHAPARGEVAVFNRSHYEDVLVVRVQGLVPEAVWSRRYEEINAFERTLRRENDTTILKLFLHISKEEQLDRFSKRLEDPTHQWKIDESDYRDRERWGDYRVAYEDAIRETSTVHAPWFVIPADRKWFRNLAVARILVETIESMKVQLPKPTADLKKIRALFQEQRAKLRKTKPSPKGR